jgi:hypothetical protein
MAEPGEGVKCIECGMVNPATMRFCGNCGKPLSVAKVAAAVAAETAPIPAPLSTPPPPVVPIAPVAQAEPVAPPVVVPPVTPATPVTAAVPSPVAAPVTTPVPPATPPAPTIEIPADPVARERERDRLLTLANVQRMRGQVSEARQTLQNAVALAEGMPPQTLAPTYELLGDMLSTEGRIEEAMEAYQNATSADPKRASAEKKFAQMTLALAEANGTLNISEAMLRGESIADLMASGALGRQQGKKNAGVAMMLSILMPGFGQMYNGQIVKGVILMGLFLGLLLIITLAPGGSAFLRQFAAFVALNPGKAAAAPAWLPVVGVAVVVVWLYGIVDAPFMAAKGVAPDDDGRPVIDKSGWEV